MSRPILTRCFSCNEAFFYLLYALQALGALKEASKHATKITGGQDRLTSLNQRIQTVERFVQARKLVSHACVITCRAL